jgi:hypothetical protein
MFAAEYEIRHILEDKICLSSHERNHITAHGFTQQISDQLKVLYGRMSKWENSIFELPHLRPDLANLGAGTAPELQTGDQWGLGLIHIWHINNMKNPPLRIVILLLFSAGLLSLAIPATVTFLQVTLLLVRQWLAA